MRDMVVFATKGAIAVGKTALEGAFTRVQNLVAAKRAVGSKGCIASRTNTLAIGALGASCFHFGHPELIPRGVASAKVHAPTLRAFLASARASQIIIIIIVIFIIILILFIIVLICILLFLFL